MIKDVSRIKQNKICGGQEIEPVQICVEDTIKQSIWNYFFNIICG